MSLREKLKEQNANDSPGWHPALPAPSHPASRVIAPSPLRNSHRTHGVPRFSETETKPPSQELEHCDDTRRRQPGEVNYGHQVSVGIPVQGSA